MQEFIAAMRQCRRPIVALAICILVLQALVAGLATAATAARVAGFDAGILCHGTAATPLRNRGSNSSPPAHDCCVYCTVAAPAALTPNLSTAGRVNPFKSSAGADHRGSRLSHAPRDPRRPLASASCRRLNLPSVERSAMYAPAIGFIATPGVHPWFRPLVLGALGACAALAWRSRTSPSNVPKRPVGRILQGGAASAAWLQRLAHHRDPRATARRRHRGEADAEAGLDARHRQREISHVLCAARRAGERRRERNRLVGRKTARRALRRIRLHLICRG